VDSILIDEARTPLIISGPSELSVDLYYKVDAIIPRLVKGEEIEDKHGNKTTTGDYIVDEKAQSASLTEQGVAKAEKLLNVDNLFDPNNLVVLCRSCHTRCHGELGHMRVHQVQEGAA
jgi:preprotein translocase subunit SecA